jgi:hypothetical protein
MHQRSCGRDPRIGVRSAIGMTAAPPAFAWQSLRQTLERKPRIYLPTTCKGGMRVYGRTHIAKTIIFWCLMAARHPFDVDASQGGAYGSV